MSETDCPICHVDLGAPSYVKVTEDSEVNELVFRLKCGHAFHNGCLCRALRTDAHCPVCRNSEPQTEEFNFTVDESGNITMEQEAPEFIATFLGGVNSMVHCMRHVDDDPDVQVERARANRAHKAYRKCEIDVSRARKRLIDKALNELRSAKRDTYDTASSKYRKTLRRLRLVEITSAQRFVGGRTDISVEDAEELYKCIEESTSIRTRANNNGAFGPLKNRFWTHF